MKKYAYIVDGVVENVIFGENDNVMRNMGYIPVPDYIVVGSNYYQQLIKTNEELTAEVNLLKAQIQAQSDRAEFIEDCIAEMATLVYV